MTLNGNTYLLLMMIAAYVGLDPAKDIEWVTVPDPVEASRKERSMRFSAVPPFRRSCANAISVT